MVGKKKGYLIKKMKCTNIRIEGALLSADILDKIEQGINFYMFTF